MSSNRRLFLLPLFLLWLFAVITFYYWGHQFVLVPAIIGLLRVAIQLTALLLLLLTAYGIGAWLLVRLGLHPAGFAARLVLAMGLGQGAMATLGLVLGLAGGLRAVVFWPITLVGGGITLSWLLRRWRADRPGWPRPWAGWSRFEWLLIGLVAVNVVVWALAALLPPVGWDGVSTHLVLARAALDAGRLLATPLFDRPLVVHLLYIWGMSLGGDSLPQLISFSQALLTGAAVWALAAPLGRRVALLAVLLLFSVEVFIQTAAWPYTDVPVAWFTVLSVLALVKWALPQTSPHGGEEPISPPPGGTKGGQLLPKPGVGETTNTPHLTSPHDGEGQRWLILAALFAALAAQTKLTGLFAAPALALAVGLGLYWRRPVPGRHLRDLAVAGLAGGLLFLVWTGGTYLLAAGGGSGDVSAVVEVAGDGLQNEVVTETGLARLAAYGRVIWLMTIWGQQGADFDGAITPFFLALLPLLLFFTGRSRRVTMLALMALLMFAGWLLVPRGYYQSRHLMLAYPLFSVVVAYLIDRLGELDQPAFTLSGFFRLILVLVFAIQALFSLVWFDRYQPLSFLLGVQTRDEYLQAYWQPTAPGFYPAIRYINNPANVPEGARVAFVRPEVRTYYCHSRCQRAPYSFNTSAAQMADLAAGEYEYLLVNWYGLDYFQENNEGEPGDTADWMRLEEAVTAFVAAHGQEVYANGDFVLYELFSAD